MILNKNNIKETTKLFKEVVNLGVDFKLQNNTHLKNLTISDGLKLIEKLPTKQVSIKNILKEFKKKILPYCTNFSSPHFMGFPDAGNSVASISGSILSDFLQQNLISQSFCAPSATFLEISVIRWFREIVGYQNIKTTKNILDVGGIVTSGGTMSNAIAMLLARENKFPNTMKEGFSNKQASFIIVPRGIGHYSVKSSQMWVGGGNRLLEVNTKDFKYDLVDLEKKLKKNKGKIMCLVAYAGDSRTMSIDQFSKIAKLVKKIDPSIWLHADACHGFSLGFSENLKYKISGIELFDSITMDPHKVLLTPYAVSLFVIKNPNSFNKIISISDLIMQEEFAFGQITPFLGSKAWNSLGLWFLIKNLGKQGIGEIIEKRHKLAKYLEEKLKNDKDFIVINKVEINAVVFLYRGSINIANIDLINALNKEIHTILIKNGVYHLHTFSLIDNGNIKKDVLIYPLRFMCGNPNTTHKDVDEMIEYVRNIGVKLSIKNYDQNNN